jgi:hypothetical protein
MEITERIYKTGGLHLTCFFFAHFGHGVRRTLSPKVYTMQLTEVLRSYDNSDIIVKLG